MAIAAEKILNRKSGGLGSPIGATQATEAVEGENFLTGQALTGLDRWGVAFQSISAASGVAAVGLGIAGIQGLDAEFFQDKFSWSDVGVSAVSGGLVSLPFGGADLAIENANTPWLNLVGAGLAPIEGYAHTLTEQGINWFSRQTPGG